MRSHVTDEVVVDSPFGFVVRNTRLPVVGSRQGDSTGSPRVYSDEPTASNRLFPFDS